jgi:hypothetical protein
MRPTTASASLRAQQVALAAALRDPTADDAPQLEGRPLLARGPSGRARLDVYQQAYAARLLGALRDNFDILARALGDEAFDALGRAYLAAHPSRQASIRWFGHRLAEFMDHCVANDDGLVPHPALADLARMDWVLRSAFDAADAPVLDLATLAALPAEAWPGLRFELHPSVQALPLCWAVAPAWHALRHHTGTGEPELPAPEAQAHTLLVWRRALATQWRVLADDEAALLQATLAGDEFTALCTQAAAQCLDDTEAAAQRVVLALQQWLADGLVSAVRLPA